MNKTIVPADLKPYLRYSAAAHGVLALGLILALLRTKAPASDVYTIDVVGPSQAITQSQAPSAAKGLAQAAPIPKAPAGHIEESKQADDFNLGHRRRHEELPPPSLLQGYQNVSAPASAAQAQAPAPSSTQPSQAPSAPGSVSMDLANFPYPWYISQIRMALWTQWSSRMPGGGGRCVVVFSILPDGSVVDLRTDESSGDAGFDLTALGAVKDAAPFPPLPDGFKKPFLKIHLTLTSS